MSERGSRRSARRLADVTLSNAEIRVGERYRLRMQYDDRQLNGRIATVTGRGRFGWKILVDNLETCEVYASELERE